MTFLKVFIDILEVMAAATVGMTLLGAYYAWKVGKLTGHAPPWNWVIASRLLFVALAISVVALFVPGLSPGGVETLLLVAFVFLLLIPVAFLVGMVLLIKQSAPPGYR